MRTSSLIISVLLLTLSGKVFSEEIVETVTPEDNIQFIIDDFNENAGDDLVIKFEPGEYSLNLDIDKKVRLEGRSTKDVILTPDDAFEPIITINGASNVDIQNLTFLDADKGIQISSSIVTQLNLEITNNVFHLQQDTNDESPNIGIQIDELADGITIDNNVFYENDIGIQNNNVNATSTNIRENIFDENNTDLLINDALNIERNCFAGDGGGFTANTSSTDTDDILFVDPENDDFHLKTNTPCEDELSDPVSEYGAYGGEGADDIPSAITISSVSVEEVNNELQATVTWVKNETRELGGYRVYYAETELKGLNTREERDNNANFIEVSDVNATQEVVTGLSIAAAQPDSPVLTSIEPRDRKLLLKWTNVANADSYKIYYTGNENNPIENVTGTEYDLTGLSNDTVYTVWITAVTELDYHFQVAAYYDNNSDSLFAESFFLFDDEVIVQGTAQESAISNQESMQPEAIVAYPILPEEGCFIATAAFGFYSAEEVKVLRDFRDKHLLTNDAGKVFVKWYYMLSPPLAEYIRQDETFKSMVRMSLAPIINMARLLDHSIFWFYITFALYLIIVTIMTRTLCRFIVRKV